MIGGGISGLVCACYLAREGLQVQLLEKNETLGGRARSFSAEGFTFDMGPSWYWMPDVFEKFFREFGHEVSDYYNLIKLEPGFRMYFAQDDYLDISADFAQLKQTFEDIEEGAGSKLDHFMKDAAYKYEVGMNDLVYQPGLSVGEFFDWRVLKGLFKLDLLTSFDKFVGRYFKHPKLRQLMEFPVLFLGAAPANTPALYSLMNYAGLVQGTFYPMGGMHKIIEALASLAKELGVEILTDAPVSSIEIRGDQVIGSMVRNALHPADFIISSADYHHTDQHLLPKSVANYDAKYWETRKMAPSCLLYYVGLDTKIEKLVHHNLFFDADFDLHSKEIYERPNWPTKPLFYACIPSKTDATVAPENCENLFLLMPLAVGIHDSEELREKYFKIMMNRLELMADQKLNDHIIYKRSYCVQDFQQDYHAFKGNAYGLANTLSQTAILKPKIRSKKLNNLIFTGHLTVPGPGVPPSFVSGKLAADQIIKRVKTKAHAITV